MARYKKREELIADAMKLWKDLESDYRTMIETYQDYYKTLKKLIKANKAESKALNPINKTMLEEYPEIPFLDISSESDAFQYVSSLDRMAIRLLLAELNSFNKNPAVVTLKARIFDYNYRIRHCNVDKRQYFGSMDPDNCGSGRHRREKRPMFPD